MITQFKFSFLTFILSLFTAGAVHASNLTDAEIVHIVQTANNAEIAAGNFASSKVKNSKLMTFAAEMVTQHTKNNSEAFNILKKVNITPVENDKSKDLQKTADKQLAELKSAANSKFDKTYLEQQVQMHQTLLKELNDVLIPSAKNADVKGYLEKTKTHVQHHLTNATDILNELK